MSVKTITQLVEEFNRVVEVAFGKKTLEYQPKLHELVASYPVPYAPTSELIWEQFLGGLSAVTDGEPIDAMTLPSNYKITISNGKYGQKVQVTESEFERAGRLSNLALYTSKIEAMAVNAKDDPIVRGLAMLEAGHTNTYGTAFDGKNFFATDHLFGDATSQSNIVTGHGNTLQQVAFDMDAAYAALKGFYGYAGGGKKLLNKNELKIMVFCSTKMVSVFKALRDKDFISGTSNSWKGAFDFEVAPFSDPDTFYMVNLENDGYAQNKPILNPIEKEARLKNNLNQESATMDGLYKWQVDLRQGIGYGAWYKAVKVDNSAAPVTTYYTVAASAGSNGTISPAGFTNAAGGSNVVLTITPAEGYVVDKLLVNGSDVTASIVTGTYTISSISENKVVTVTFKES